MFQVAHQPSIGQRFNEPRCPPTAPPTSPSIRQRIVRMVKTNKPEPITAELKQSNDRIRRPLVLLSSNHRTTRSILRHEFTDVRREPNNQVSDQQKGPLEKQNSNITNIGSIRRLRLPLRPQREHSTLSVNQGAHSKADKENVILNQSQSSSENKECSTNNSCEVKGCAIIKNSSNYIGTQKKRVEIHKKTQQLSASLNEFKRRLMMNQGKFHNQQPGNQGQGDQYKVSPSNQMPSPPLQPRAPLAPRSPFSRSSLIKRSSNEGINPQAQDFNENSETSPKPTYRLQLQQVTKQIHPVETYVVVQNQRERMRGKFDEPIALTMHNLSMHNMFIEMDEKKIKDGKSVTNARVDKWVETVHACAILPHRTVRFNVTSSESSAGDSDSFSSH